MSATAPIVAQAASAVPLRILFLLTALTLAPALVVSMTAFLRIVVVLGFLRHALGLQQMPPNQVIIGLSLFLTYFVMGPAMDRIHHEALEPLWEGKVQEVDALQKAAVPLKQFMLAQTREKDLALMINLAGMEKVETAEAVPMRVVVPAFVVSELRTAFAIGFLLFIPFLIIDLSVAALLNALGMVMLPPTSIALPFKLLVFVLADGWAMTVGALVKSFAS